MQIPVKVAQFSMTVNKEVEVVYGGAKESQTQVRNQTLTKPLPGLTIKNSIGEHQWCLTIRA